MGRTRKNKTQMGENNMIKEVVHASQSKIKSPILGGIGGTNGIVTPVNSQLMVQKMKIRRGSGPSGTRTKDEEFPKVGDLNSYLTLTEAKEGKLVVKLSEEDKEIGNEIWSNAIILYVIGNTPSIGAIMRFITTEWNFVAKPKVYMHNDGFFVVKLNCSEDKESILVEVHTCLEVLRTIPLWVQFPILSLHYWGLAALSKIGSALGKPMYADECTSRLGRISYARVLTEMDVTKPLPRHDATEGAIRLGANILLYVLYCWT
ncbi:hypothetical protein H5410_056096 [Solanum commersonii]|uniref:DUF4283 domain-containing protein n=1 Tax=Solanum commersonii TaxID=4109 RepID=A0A9J5WK98_SOLCO|nr:hypothetical protein H5410_056096 [Solanum commersonii]